MRDLLLKSVARKWYEKRCNSKCWREEPLSCPRATRQMIFGADKPGQVRLSSSVRAPLLCSLFWTLALPFRGDSSRARCALSRSACAGVDGPSAGVAVFCGPRAQPRRNPWSLPSAWLNVTHEPQLLGQPDAACLPVLSLRISREPTRPLRSNHAPVLVCSCHRSLYSRWLCRSVDRRALNLRCPSSHLQGLIRRATRSGPTSQRENGPLSKRGQHAERYRQSNRVREPMAMVHLQSSTCPEGHQATLIFAKRRSETACSVPWILSTPTDGRNHVPEPVVETVCKTVLLRCQASIGSAGYEQSENKKLFRISE
jgi:hypothetical protein